MLQRRRDFGDLSKLFNTDTNCSVVYSVVMEKRFYTITDVAEMLNISVSATRSLIHSGDLPAIQIGGKQAWRIEASELEAFIQRQYALTREKIAAGEF